MNALLRLFLGSVVLALGATLSYSSLARSAVIHLLPLERYANCTPDPRIYCEPGSERFAQSIASMMPEAIARVERAQYGPFVKPVRVYTYRSVDSFVRWAGGPQGMGRTVFGEVHLSPRLVNVAPDDQPRLLTHELSHLHLQQRVGDLAMLRLPVWFMEGWPTLVSGGGGAAGTHPDGASYMLLHGRHFEPAETSSLLSPESPASFGLSNGMFYRQASLMVEYMQRRDAAAFSRMIHAIEAGQRFGPSVQSAYGRPLPALWQDFRADLRQRSAVASR